MPLVIAGWSTTVLISSDNFRFAFHSEKMPVAHFDQWPAGSRGGGGRAVNGKLARQATLTPGCRYKGD